jgi:hypothetical protein
LLNLVTSNDTAATRTALIQQLTILGLASSTFDSYVDASQSFATVLSPNPTPQQIAEFPEKLKQLDDAIKALFESQPGLQNFTTDPKFKTDPSTQAFLELYESEFKIFRSLNVTSAYELYVTNGASSFAAIVGFLKTLKSVSDKVSSSAGNFNF